MGSRGFRQTRGASTGLGAGRGEGVARLRQSPRGNHPEAQLRCGRAAAHRRAARVKGAWGGNRALSVVAVAQRA